MPDKFGDKGRLLHINDAIESIEAYTNGIDFNGFSADHMCFDACVRQLSIIGEASNHLSKSLCERFNEVPWPEIIALRNLVVHEYFGVDTLVIWKIIRENIPELKRQVLVMIGEVEG